MEITVFVIRLVSVILCVTRHMTEGRTANELAELISAKNDKMLLRPNVSGDPVLITVQIYVLSVGSVQEDTMDFKVDMYFRQSWYNHDLKFDANNTDHINLDAKKSINIWEPDTYFENSRDAKIQDIPSKNKLYRIYTDGRVLTSSRIGVRIVCDMEFRKFPLDTQECYLKLGSYGMTTDHVLYRWEPTGGAFLSKTLHMAQFSLPRAPNTWHVDEKYAIGTFRFLLIDFVLVRRIGFYLSNFYVPVAMIVALSWVSFWITPHSVPARVTLGVVTVLAMTAFITSKGKAPSTSYSTAMDVYVFTCFTFVFAALVEFAVVHHRFIKRAQGGNKKSSSIQRVGAAKKNNSKPGDSPDDAMPPRYRHLNLGFTRYPIRTGDDDACADQAYPSTPLGYFTPLISSTKLDKIARFAFPGMFALFNVGYWIFFL